MQPVLSESYGGWKQEAERASFAEEIQSNLDSLNKQPPGTIDLEFFKILQRDIDFLRERYQKETKSPDDPKLTKLNEMNTFLGEIAARNFSGGSPDVKVPNVGPLTAPTQLGAW